MLLGLAIGVLTVADVAFLIKQISKYKSLTELIKKLNTTQYLNVTDVIKQLQDKGVGQKIQVIVKGIIKAKQSSPDKNIFSAIISTPINKADRLKQYAFQRIPYRKVIKKAFAKRPQKLHDISFNLHDISGVGKISVQYCKGADISGILTTLKQFQTKVVKNSANLVLSFFKELFNGIMFLSPFKFSNKIGQKITYYGIIDNSFGYVIGQARKKANGQVIIQKPQFITKQIAFLLNRYKNIQKIFKYALILFIILQIILLVYLLKWFKNKYGDKIKQLSQRQHEEVDENLPLYQLCIVCYSSARSVIFKPCRHYGVCFSCYNRLNRQTCPVCKEPIEGIIKVVKK